jgi:multidrug efflux pump subunit AcrB
VCAKAFGRHTRHQSASTPRSGRTRRARFLRCNRQRAETLGIPVAAIAQTVQAALSGMDAAYLHDGQSKYPVPVRLQLPRDAQVGLDALLALPMRRRPTARWCRCPNWSGGDRRDRQAPVHQGPAGP